jgi:glycine cleavage system H protein
MPSPADRRYTKEHEWVRIDGDLGIVGITDYAQDQLGDLVYLAVSDLYSPVSGEVTEVNQEVIDRPELVNQSPYEEGWLVRLRLAEPAELDSLLTAAQYDELIA